MDYTRDSLAEWSDSHKTTDELAQAILEFARDEEHADKIWMGDDDTDWPKIKARAWALVDKSDVPDRDFLWCGEGKIYRT